MLALYFFFKRIGHNLQQPQQFLLLGFRQVSLGQFIGPAADPGHLIRIDPALGSQPDVYGPSVLPVVSAGDQFLAFHFCQKAGHGRFVDTAERSDLFGGESVPLPQTFQNLWLAGQQRNFGCFLHNEFIAAAETFQQQKQWIK